MLTGGAQTNGDDWAAIIGGQSPDWLMPTLVISGPAYSSKYTASTLRVGPDGQLAHLLDGQALTESDVSACSATRNQHKGSFGREQASVPARQSAPRRWLTVIHRLDRQNRSIIRANRSR